MPPKPSQPGTAVGQQGPRGTSGGQRGGWVWDGKAWVWQTADEAGPAGKVGSAPIYQENAGSTAMASNPAGAGGPTSEGYVKPPYTPSGENPFGNDMMNLKLSYTPFGLNDGGRSAFAGMPRGFGLSYNSDNLVPSLEQRRMAMLQQMLGGGQ